MSDSFQYTEHNITIPEGVTKIRADKALPDLLEGVSRSQVQEAFRLGHVMINEQIINKSYRVEAGNAVLIKLPIAQPSSVLPVEMNLDIIFEDEDLIVINKAAGQVVHPGNGTGEDTLVHALLHHTQSALSTASGDQRPGVVHRLDKETSGLIVFAKNDKTYHALVQAFSEREVEKIYTAIVVGVPRLHSGVIEAPIGRHPQARVKMAVVPVVGKPARTDWERVETYPPYFAHLRLYLHTGRTHQIRVHLSHGGHPIAGDRTYGYRPRPGTPVAPRVLLHAETLSFLHPTTQQRLRFTAAMPADMVDFLAQLQKTHKDNY